MKKYIYLLLVAVSLSSCSDFLSAYSQDQVVPKEPSDLDELLIGDVYLQTNDGYTSNGASPSAPLGFLNILDDDINTTATSLQGNVGSQYYTYSVKNLFGYFTWQQDVRYNYGGTSKAEDDVTWNTFYNRILKCNVILDEGERMTEELNGGTWTEKQQSTLDRVYGEAHFLRAQFFFYLANLYGQPYSKLTADTALCVPLKLAPYVEYDKQKDTQFQRATVKEVYDQIVKDLLLAEDYLTKSPQKAEHRLHRASWEAADILLSRVYLYMQEWEKAEQKAQKVINESQWLQLATVGELTNPKGFLIVGNPEIAFSQNSNYLAQNENDWMVSGSISDYCVSNDLYLCYDEGDVRRRTFFTVNSITDSVGLVGKYERKLKNEISDCMTLRMSEAYLNLAEACAMQPGKEAQANQALNTLRAQRIENYNSMAYTGTDLIDQVRLERRRELCFEGHRWFDIRRYSVVPEHPLRKDIIHAYCDYNDNSAYVGTNFYLLPAGDAAYTFSIPRTVLDFDRTPMPNNLRPEREAIPQEEEEPTTENPTDNPTESTFNSVRSK